MNKTYFPPPPLFHHSKWLMEVNEFMVDHLSDRNLTVADIAGAVFLSERQFYRKLKKATGKTPNEYLTEIRLRKGKALLESGHYSTLKEVALSIGYSRSDYFSHLFESHYGFKPAYYFHL